MSDNVPLNDGTGTRKAATDQVTYSGDTAEVQIVRLAQVTGAEGSKTVVEYGPTSPFNVSGSATVASGTSFTRPADTTAYASGDLVANSTTAGSVVVLSFANAARVAAGGGMIRRCRLRKSGTSVTNAQFRLHLFSASPGTITNGDNGAFSVSGSADYIGAFDIIVDRAFTDGAVGVGVPVSGSEIDFKLPSGTTIYGFLEARGAYTPTSGETIAPTLEIIQD